jgi:hypothetical protein
MAALSHRHRQLLRLIHTPAFALKIWVRTIIWALQIWAWMFPISNFKKSLLRQSILYDQERLAN